MVRGLRYVDGCPNRDDLDFGDGLRHVRVVGVDGVPRVDGYDPLLPSVSNFAGYGDFGGRSSWDVCRNGIGPHRGDLGEGGNHDVDGGLRPW